LCGLNAPAAETLWNASAVSDWSYQASAGSAGGRSGWFLT
jgi:hypothetical protein